MPVCPICGKQLVCDGHSADVSASVERCPENLPGSLWVRVVSDDQKPVTGIDIALAGTAAHGGKTLNTGFAGFDGLNAGPYTVTLGTIPKEYEPPKERIQRANVKKGSTKIVTFELQRRAQLKVEIVKENSPDTVLETPAVKVTRTPPSGSPDTKNTDKGVYDYTYVPAGKYKLVAEFADSNQQGFVFIQTEEQYDLKAGEEKTIRFVLRPLVKLDVKIILKGPPEKVAQEPVVKVTKTPDGGMSESKNTDKGLTSFGYLPEGKYKLAVEIEGIEKDNFEFPEDEIAKEVELKTGKDEVVPFLIEPLYKKVQFIGHCLPTIAKQLWTDDAKEAWARHYRTLYEGFKKSWLENEARDDWRDEDELEWQNQWAAVKEDQLESWLKAGGRDYWRARYNGLTVESQDIDARVAFIKKTIEKAKSAVPEKDDELKVFMMPECYFLAKYGAYEVENLSALIGKLQQLVKGPEWRHWLFAFGTVNGVYYDDADENIRPRKVAGLFNVAPVIRGGCESDGKAHEYTRTIQKVTYCQEMLALTDLETKPTSPEGKRLPAPDDKSLPAGESLVSETVGYGFGDTQNEVLLGKVIGELLADNEPQIAGKSIAAVFAEQGLSAGHWTELKAVAKAAVESRGMPSIVRKIRSFALPKPGEQGKPTLDTLGDCEFCGFQIERSVNPFRVILIRRTWKDIAKALLMEALAQSPRKTFLLWKKASNAEKLPKLRILLNLCDGRSAVIVIPDHQRSRLKASVQNVVDEVGRNNDVPLNEILNAEGSVPDRSTWEFDWAPIFKRLVLIYTAGKATETSLFNSKPVYNFDDFSFVCRRRPSPLLASGESPGAKKIYFGLEICADHQESRLSGIIQAMATKPTIDIQLVPSAGMVIQPDKLVARANGFGFNCDGWNADGVRLTMLRRRNAKILEFNTPDWPVDPGHNPLYPHSEVVKSTGPGSDPSPITPPSVVALNDLKTDAADIFGYSPGELHIYPVQPLPPPV